MNRNLSYQKAALYIDKLWYRLVNQHRTQRLLDKDWDNLIILDACRYDMFSQVNNMEGELTALYSKGSSTAQFLVENFLDKKCHDTVYVTGNPLVSYYLHHEFFKVISVWENGWHEKFGTVLPDTMVDYSKRAHQTYPHKRLILHFMQPHYPFIDHKTREIIGVHDGIYSRDLMLGKEVRHTQTVWHLYKKGKLNKRTVWWAYCVNLRIVLESVRQLLKDLQGKTVITSDHGNLFAEWLWPLPLKEYGHFGGLYKKSIIKVPWFVIQNGERKRIWADEPDKDQKNELNLEEYRNKLKALGYVD